MNLIHPQQAQEAKSIYFAAMGAPKAWPEQEEVLDQDKEGEQDDEVEEGEEGEEEEQDEPDCEVEEETAAQEGQEAEVEQDVMEAAAEEATEEATERLEDMLAGAMRQDDDLGSEDEEVPAGQLGVSAKWPASSSSDGSALKKKGRPSKLAESEKAYIVTFGSFLLADAGTEVVSTQIVRTVLEAGRETGELPPDCAVEQVRHVLRNL